MLANLRRARKITEVKFNTIIINCCLVLSGCVSYDFDENLERINQDDDVVPSGEVVAAITRDQQDALNNRATLILQDEVGEFEAVELMLLKSPSFQRLLFENLAEGSLAAQTGNISNPTLSLERMVKGTETEYGRFLTFGLIDVFTLPMRKKYANRAVQSATLNLEANIFGAITGLRLAWLEAVAAEERFSLAEDTYTALSASAELAKRMKQAGNMATSERIDQQLLFSAATVALAEARQQRLSSREKLIRLLGLGTSEGPNLQLPSALPDIPAQPIQPEDIEKDLQQRFDVRAARLDYEMSLEKLGIENIMSYTDIELGYRNDRIDDDGTISKKRGYEIEIKIPVFDWGNLERDAAQADALSRQNEYKQVVLNAGSEVRVAYGAYRTAFDIAEHYRDQVLPMQETLLEEANYNYNGMIIGVFELLQAGTAKASAEINAITAKQNTLAAAVNLYSVLAGNQSDMEFDTISASETRQDKGH